VVGSRVVVRRLVPGETGPTGGPAFTDVLGVCTAWGERVVIATDGGPVAIDPALIVSGKPVPPRPSVRLRVGAREAELHTAALWPGVAAHPLGEWQLRIDAGAAGRPLKRANSCLAMGDPGVEVAEALERVDAFYRGRDRRPLVQVESGSAVEDAVLAAGWRTLRDADGEALGEASFRLTSIAALRRRLGGRADAGVQVEVATTDGTGDGDTDGAVQRVAASVLDAPAGRGGGLRIATGLGVLDGDWLGLHGVVTEPAYRRRGLAHAVVAALGAWGAERGGRTAWLHVETANAAAVALYERLGFEEHHRCRYLEPPLTPPPAPAPAP
jgi:N-acetylglutamate synthase